MSARPCNGNTEHFFGFSRGCRTMIVIGCVCMLNRVVGGTCLVDYNYCRGATFITETIMHVELKYCAQ